jgi:hypothetical protein
MNPAAREGDRSMYLSILVAHWRGTIVSDQAEISTIINIVQRIAVFRVLKDYAANAVGPRQGFASASKIINFPIFQALKLCFRHKGRFKAILILTGAPEMHSAPMFDRKWKLHSPPMSI